MSDMPDLMTFLRAEYDRFLQQQTDESKITSNPDAIQPTLDGFVEFSRQYLAKENQPLNVSYLAVGLGLRLQQGQIVSFASQETLTRPMRDEGVHITRPKSIPGQHGIIDTDGIHVFGGKN